ncbi:hypothetical protein COCC4DRAFT_145736 [Bipolaris maydis ATCC 48331]|uniref:Membrane anchor Opy2 N-terminal domain-containing protein n=2 Tax=Cochliobolus heterostrophus TaxID=5016 RepID=M2UJJ1_COCH5|nr:uncharacterized protein COCC4DRAFT_145736 [Bipolaris maydis ATCC 48331]EMD88163.1 hypothetical protein COCHEDRAFT_1217233 [Bipolaris maydis C5]KAJ5057817.1 hypothetical protein J3E74DRAFT_409296 [Bipolaris maydis]ENI02258.1 hypothetical protein COCC4DRAFT_145736 [Bipolaris maydis ATCC 48331]KAJ6207131.1 hypothetical protein PSV09DRAFT_1217233 [Bipolaris maydis]KAJ6268367.1 hypothetical protein PSV08DRAFT_354021 [Bipolaris maydis]
MRVTAGVLAGFVAVGIAAQSISTTKPEFSKAFGEAHRSESDRVDGDWRFGCDGNNHCSYYHNAAAATSVTASDSVHPVEEPYSEWSAKSVNATAIVVRVVEISKANTTSSAVTLNMNDNQLARRSQNVSLHADTQPLFGRHVAFTGDQCEECDINGCPECHSDCVQCQHFKCVDPSSGVSMCMSVRPKYLVPCDPVPRPVETKTKTIYYLPVPTPISAETIITSRQARSVATTAPLPTTIGGPSVTITVSTVVTKTTTVLTPFPTQTTKTVFREVSIVPIDPDSTIISTQTIRYLTPVTKPIMLDSRRNLIIPRTPSASSPTPSFTTAHGPRVTGLLSRQQYNIKEASCNICEDASACQECNFACPSCGGNLFCNSPFSSHNICIDMLDTANVSTASDKILGRAATLLVQRDANAVASNNGSTSAKPWDIQDDGSVLSLKFGYTDCRACTPGDRDCRGCKPRFDCSEMNKCVRFDETAIVEVCYETETFCPA